MGYEANGIKYDFNSIKNQEIKRKFIARDVYVCVTSTTEYILRKAGWDGDYRDAPFCWDDVTNAFEPVCPECGDTYGFEEIDAFKCECCDRFFEVMPDECPCLDEYGGEEEESLDLVEVQGHKCGNCDHIVENLDELDTRPQEIYEWWAVSSYLCEQLEAMGECVIPHEHIWGRSCTGQAILLDGVISRICYKMGILEGQEWDWSRGDVA